MRRYCLTFITIALHGSFYSSISKKKKKKKMLSGRWRREGKLLWDSERAKCYNGFIKGWDSALRGCPLGQLTKFPKCASPVITDVDLQDARALTYLHKTQSCFEFWSIQWCAIVRNRGAARQAVWFQARKVILEEAQAAVTETVGLQQWQWEAFVEHSEVVHECEKYSIIKILLSFS